MALRKLFDPETLLVSANKSLVGHTMAAAGSLEAIATVLTLAHELVPPTANLAEPDPEIGVRLRARKSPVPRGSSTRSRTRSGSAART